jgi:hypothetical protein
MEGVGPEIETFLGLEMAMSEASAIRPKKVETEANRNSRSTCERVSFLGWTSRTSIKEYSPAMGGLYSVVNLVQDNIFPIVRICQPPSNTQAAWRVLHLSLYIPSLVFLAATVVYWFFSNVFCVCSNCGCSKSAFVGSKYTVF